MSKEHDAYKKLCRAEENYDRNRLRDYKDEEALEQARKEYAKAKSDDEKEREENRRNYRSGNYLGGYNGYY